MIIYVDLLMISILGLIGYREYIKYVFNNLHLYEYVKHIKVDNKPLCEFLYILLIQSYICIRNTYDRGFYFQKILENKGSPFSQYTLYFDY